MAAIARFHFHPNISIKIEKDNIQANHSELSFEGAKDLTIRSYELGLEFNKRQKSKVLEVSFNQLLKTEITIL